MPLAISCYSYGIKVEGRSHYRYVDVDEIVEEEDWRALQSSPFCLIISAEEIVE